MTQETDVIKKIVAWLIFVVFCLLLFYGHLPKAVKLYQIAPGVFDVINMIDSIKEAVTFLVMRALMRALFSVRLNRNAHLLVMKRIS